MQAELGCGLQLHTTHAQLCGVLGAAHTAGFSSTAGRWLCLALGPALCQHTWDPWDPWWEWEQCCREHSTSSPWEPVVPVLCSALVRMV